MFNKRTIIMRQKFDSLMFQMQIYIIVVLLLYSGAVSGGLEKVLRLAEFISDIYQQFPHSCIFIINPEAQQQDEDYVLYRLCNFCIFSGNLLTDSLRGHTCELLHEER
jgi:hypothetical protein